MSTALELLKEEGRIGKEVVAPAPPAGTPPAGDPPAGNPPAGDPPAGNPPAGDPPVEPKEVDEATVREFLKKKHGIEVDNLGDLKPADKPLTEEEQRKLDEKVREDAIKHAINSNTFSTKEFEAYTKDSQRSKEDIAYEIVKQQWIKDDPTLEDKDLQERFRDYFKLDEPEDNWQRKGRNHELTALANRYFEVKYPKIIGAEDVYKQHLGEIEAATSYNKRVERTFENLRKDEAFELEIPTDKEGVTEKKTYKFSFSADSIAEVKKAFLEKTSFEAMRAYKDEGLSDALQLALLKKEYPKMVAAIAREHATDLVLQQKAGRKGIVPDNVTLGKNQTVPGTEAKSGAASALLKEEKRL